MRAILLPSAMATTLNGRRARRSTPLFGAAKTDMPQKSAKISTLQRDFELFGDERSIAVEFELRLTS
jgi:hypothetical protein